MEWFENTNFRNLVKNNLPTLFKKAELETTRGGKIGMEVGVLRERILCSILIKSFGVENITTEFGVTENSKDVKVFDDILSIKTFTNDGYSGIKVFWASDNQSVKTAVDSYKPKNHLLVSQIKWGTTGNGLFLIPLGLQNIFFEKYGVYNYLKINSGNNRGISFQTNVLKEMLNHVDTKKIRIEWNEPELRLNVFERWINELK